MTEDRFENKIPKFSMSYCIIEEAYQKQNLCYFEGSVAQNGINQHFQVRWNPWTL